MTELNDNFKEAFDLLAGDEFPTFAGIMAGFRRMDLAEEEIAAAKERHPEQAEELHAAFGLLFPPAWARDKTIIYRAWCREILERVASGEPVDAYPTDVELLVALSEMSQKMPFNGVGLCLASRLFAKRVDGKFGPRLFGVDGAGSDTAMMASEALYGRQADELYRQMRDKGARDRRR